ncbi:DUF4652 domain-containing protein [Bacillus sp. JJ1566]|uniref:DUF4652 domain-containing protein n=1 Tax=Bacillus sp. JJ1566 TaxID=3122961 RepID=UPI002FFE2F77
MRKIMFFLLITFILSGCLGLENGETEASIDEVEVITIDEGTITIGRTENELILNEEGYEGIPLLEYANQQPSIVTNPNETATIRIDNDPKVAVYLWDKYVPLKSNSFSIPYETGRYVYNIEAKWPTKEANFIAVIEVPYEFKRVRREKEPDDPNEWILSPNGEKQVMIEGLGEFEANGTIVLKELTSNTIENIDFNHGLQWTAKKIAWYDNDSVLTTIGLVHGTVTRGGNLYHLNLTTLELTPILELPFKEEVADFSIEGNLLTYEVHVYEDDEMNKGYMETRTLELSTIEN